MLIEPYEDLAEFTEIEKDLIRCGNNTKTDKR